MVDPKRKIILILMCERSKMELKKNENGARVVGIDAQEFATTPELMALDLSDTDLARALTYLAQGKAFEVIEDPDAFQAAYMQQIENEDPAAPFQAHAVRLIDFGVPDFTQIHAPKRDQNGLTWAAKDNFTGLPYLCTADPDLTGDPAFSPLPLSAYP